MLIWRHSLAKSTISRNLNQLAQHFSMRSRSLSTLQDSSHSSKVDDHTNSTFTVVRHPYVINDIPLSESTNLDKFAIINLSASQFKVTVDDLVVADYMEGLEIGDIVNLNKIPLVGSRIATVIGHPFIETVEVIAQVEEVTKDRKVMIFKFRRRKNSKRLRGFRRKITVLRITDIVLGKHEKLLMEI